MKNNTIYYCLLIILLYFLFLINYFCKTKYESYKNENKVNLKNNTKIKSDINECYSIVMDKKEDLILEQLIKIWIKIAKELDIRWSVCGGSYIGAIRHKGRIPWDDDFDVTIMKEDVSKIINNIDRIMLKYKVTISKFWGGYKLFFNDERAIKKFDNYGWNWPFIDIFTLDNEIDCSFLTKDELPLLKTKFDNGYVYISKNTSKDRNIIKNKKKWKNELFDTGYRHQIESNIKNKCVSRKIV